MSDNLELSPARSRRELAERRSSAPRARTRRVRANRGADRPAAPIHRNAVRRVLRKLMTTGAMAGAAALLISTSLPASAFLSATSMSSASANTASVSVGASAQTAAAQLVLAQNLRVDDSASLAAPTRDAYSVVSLVQQIATKYASAARSTAYTNDPNGTVQWPFPVPVPITSGFGPRMVPGCGYCSTFHQGVDFTPGLGVPIQAIANGVVSKVEFDSGGLGNNVTIDHNINGQKVQSVYGHMLAGSVRVAVGQMVKVTDEVGQVGNTGASTGAHLHLEIHLNNTPVDPFAWLKANAN